MINSLKKYYRWMRGYFYNCIEPFDLYVPKSLAFSQVGRSYLWKPILLYQYGEPNAETTILMNFWMHGNEVWTVKLAIKLLEALDTKELQVPDSMRILVISCLNPDGFEEALQNPDYLWWWSIWKFNGNDVELVKNISLDENHTKKTKMRISGKMIEADWWDYAFSELESKALRGVIEKNNPDLFIDYHNAYPCIGWETTSWAKLVAQKYREFTWWKDWSELYVTPDFKWYKSIWLNTIFVEWTNRYSSDWKIHKRVLPKLFDYIINIKNDL